MSLEHKNVVRNNDEYFCTACGKSWDSTDRDPPACDAVRHQSAPIKLHNLPPRDSVAVLSNGGQKMTMGAQEKLVPWPTPENPHRFMERMLVEQANCAPLTRADFATVTAFLVDEIGNDRYALLVYAPDRNTAQKYAAAVTGRTATMEVRRLQGMDAHGFGRACYCELNPRLLTKATKMARKEVVPLFTWRHLA